MSGLFRLANELLAIITGHTSPHDIENLTLSCTKLYHIGKNDLSKHRDLQREHIVWECHGTEHMSSECQGTHLLTKMLKDPHRVFYVREMSFNDQWMDWPDDPESEPVLPEHLELPYSEGIIERVKEVVSRVVPQDEISDWLRWVRSGVEFPAPSLLFPLLLLPPNLTHLEIQYRLGSHEHTYATLCRIVKMKGPGVPLSRLRHVKISNSLAPMELKCVSLFAALPSIASIEGREVRDPGIEANPDIELAPRTSGVREIAFIDCSINLKALIGFLECSKALRSFTYHRLSSEIAETDERGRFDPRRLCSDVRVLAGSTLQSLSILSQAKGEDYMGDLHGFVNLRYLRTEIQLLLSGPIADCARASIARALPSRLETLELVCRGRSYEEFWLAKLLFGLAEMKTECVPALRKVEIITHYGPQDLDTSKPEYTHETVVRAFSNQGIELIVNPEEDYDYLRYEI